MNRKLRQKTMSRINLNKFNNSDHYHQQMHLMGLTQIFNLDFNNLLEQLLKQPFLDRNKILVNHKTLTSINFRAPRKWTLIPGEVLTMQILRKVMTFHNHLVKLHNKMSNSNKGKLHRQQQNRHYQLIQKLHLQ